ncbi:MAG: hypothetical protein KIS78_28710 [Labilithrix sp.]|nr:hypothetical protein [Labilithrix sp.]
MQPRTHAARRGAPWPWSVARGVAALALLVVLLAIGPRAYAAPEGDAGADAALADAASGDSEDAGDASRADAAPSAVVGELDAAVAAGRAELSSLLAFREGRLGVRRSAELFRLDLRDEAAVERSLVETTRELEIARVRLPRPPAAPPAQDRDAASPADAGAVDDLFAAPPSDELARRITARSLEVRVEILTLSTPERVALLAAEQDAVRAEATRREREDAYREAALAEEAQRKALQAAQEARSNVERQLAEVRARVEAARGAQLRVRADIVEHRREADAAAATQAVMLEKVRRDVSAVAVGSPEADALFDRVIGDLVELRARADRLLDRVQANSPAPRPSGSVELPSTSEPELARERERLAEELAKLERAAVALETDDRAETWAALRAVMHAERDLNGQQIALLRRISEPKREELLGFGPEGRAQGLREVARVKLEIRWLRAAGWETLRETLHELRRPSAIAHVSFELVALGALLWVTMFVRRRRSRWLRRARNAAARSVRRPALLRALQRGTSALDAVGGELVSLGAVLLVPQIPGLDVSNTAWSVPYTLLLWYWIYRLALTVTHRSLASAASRGGVLAGEVGERILRSVRLVGRAAFFFAVLLASSAAVVGRGYLHGVVVRAAWLMAVPIVLILVRRWRDDIARMYLRVQPAGPLSRLVSRTRTRWVGFFVVVAAFVVLLGSGVVRALRRFVLGFEHSRKALAFLFRRRLERQVAQGTPGDEPRLEPEVLEYFTERPVAGGELAIERYPGLDDFAERFARWRAGKPGGSTLITGRGGFGKTSWLLAAELRCRGVPMTRIENRRRALRPADVVAVIAEASGAPASIDDVEGLARHLRGRGRQVITVDDAQLWFVRGAEKLDGWRAFVRLMELTGDEVLWVVAFAHYSWELLSWIERGEHAFQTVVHLAPWSESEIGKLLERRNEASGLEIVYDDLLIDDASDGNETARILTTTRDYNRLIWDYSEGSPRVALHVWGRALVHDGPSRARVRLFTNPDAQVLEELGEPARFVLAAVVWHGCIALDEAAATLAISRRACEAAFHHLVEHEIAELDAGMYRLSPRWWPVVLRYLRRKHLIET